MEKFFNLLVINFSNFYSELNDVGKLVFFISLLLLLILIVLIVIMMIQKSIQNKIEIRQLNILKEDEEKLEKIKETEEIEELSIDESNDKTMDLKNIVEELKKAGVEEKKDVTDIYEDEQEKTAIISYRDLIKIANGEHVDTPVIKKIEPNELKPKKQEVFSSVFTPNQEPIYKAPEKQEVSNEYDNNEMFLRSLKEFRNNL